MEKVLAFDIAAVLIMLIIIFAIFYRGMYRGKENVIFLIFAVVLLLASVFSLITSVAIRFPEGKNVTLRYVYHSMYLWLRTLIAPLYAIYVMALTDTWHKIKRFAAVLFSIPYIIIVVAVALNPFNHKMFYIDSELNYTRGDWFIGLYICSVFYMFAVLVELHKYKELLKKNNFIAIAALVPFTLLAVIIQFRYPNITIEMYALAISSLMITVTVQRPEEIIDSMTGLHKFSAYTNDIKKWFTSGKPIDLIGINISNYATLYSMLGYDGVTELLRKVAKELRRLDNELKSHARIYYLDSGRYRCVLERKYSDYTENLAKQINRVLKNGIRVNDMDINIIGYVSIVRCPEDIKEFEAVIQYGNEVDNIVPYSGEVIYARDVVNRPTYYQQKDMNRILEEGLSMNRFEVYYQPIYSLKHKRFTSAEALLRLRDENGVFISPEVFIPAAEKTGIINMIGDYVMEEVCKFIDSDAFRETGVEYIEVNLSVSQCMQSGLADRILSTMRKHNVRPSQMNLEITETAATYAQNRMMENLERLSQAGVTFSLDDYGTGYSNIRRVASLPLKIVKLDKSFVDMQNNPRMWIILRNTVKMLKDMDMEIVVEGVETAQMVQKFAELECEYIQGYYYSKPVPRPDFVSFVCDGDSIAGKNA